MYIYVLQYRRSGEDYQVATFATRQEAQEVAFSFLLHASGILCEDLNDWGILCEDSSYNESAYEAVAEHCHDNDIAYIEITKHKLPTRWW